MSTLATPRDRLQRRSLAVRNRHRDKLDYWAKAYDLDCGGEFAGKCSRCLRDLYVWEDSRNPARATSYTRATAQNLGVPGFFIQFEDDGAGELAWMKVTMIYPESVEIGGEDEFWAYLRMLRRVHQLAFHDPHKLIAAARGSAPPPVS